MTISTKAMVKGTMPILRCLRSALKRVPELVLNNSFCNNSARSTNIPINATDPARAAVVTVETVEVVTVEIILLPLCEFHGIITIIPPNVNGKPAFLKN